MSNSSSNNSLNLAGRAASGLSGGASALTMPR